MINLEYSTAMRLDAVLARKQIINTYYHKANRNTARTARLCGISRKTAHKYLKRFFQEGEAGLKNRSRRPWHCPQKTPDHIEDFVIQIFDQTNYGFRRIARALRRQGVVLSYRTVGKILKRHNKCKPRRKITIRRTGRRFYNPLHYQPFEFLQIDVKEVVDGDTLPAETYTHLKELAKKNVPLYQFTAIDVRTRLRFLAYGQQDSFANGWSFMILVILWLRSFGIKYHIIMQTDWGEEFGGTSGKKIAWMNCLLGHLDAEITRIQKGRAQQNGYVERSHRTDDEEFYIPYGVHIKDMNTLFLLAYSWIRYYNTKRPHMGDNLDGVTPLAYTKTTMPNLSSNIAVFPPVILDYISTKSKKPSVTDVCEHYILLFLKDENTQGREGYRNRVILSMVWNGCGFDPTKITVAASSVLLCVAV
jgi:transposase InsO family protein